MFDVGHGLTKAPGFNQGANTLKIPWFKPGGLVKAGGLVQTRPPGLNQGTRVKPGGLV